MPKHSQSRGWWRVARQARKWSAERHARTMARAKKRSTPTARSPCVAETGTTVVPTLPSNLVATVPVSTEASRPVLSVAPAVALDARGARVTTTCATLANAPVGTLLHRIGASAYRMFEGGSGSVDASLSLAQEAPAAVPARFDPCMCQEDGSYFVDVRSEWLEVILDFLAHGVVTAPKFAPSVVLGVQAAADFLGIAALSLACAAKWARAEAADAPPDQCITINVVTPRDIAYHTGALDVFSHHINAGSTAPLSFTLLAHHKLGVVAHMVHEALDARPKGLVFYGCIARRNTTLRPAGRIDPVESHTALGNSWATRNRVMWLFVTRRKPSDVLPPVVSCGPALGIPRDAPLLLFVKVFDPKRRRLNAPRHVVIADPNATVASALPTLIGAVDLYDEDVDIKGVAIYEESNNSNVHAVDLQRSFAHAEIENGDILWLCVDPAAVADLGKRASTGQYEWITRPPGPTW